MRSNGEDAHITRRPFGSTRDGRPVDLFVLSNAAGLQASVITYGGIVTSLSAPDRHGELGDVVLGFDCLDDYLAGHPYFGAIVGRYANRISRGRFTLDGKSHLLACNDGDNHLHGGVEGFDKALWQPFPRLTPAGAQLELRHVSPDGDEGYPGRLEVAVTYDLTDDNELRIDYRAVTDRPTHVNLTHHGYFNLGGPASAGALDHVLEITADRFIPVGTNLLPTGEMRPVNGTPMDFREPTPIGKRIDEHDEQLQFGSGYDHSWVLNRTGDGVEPAARVVDPATGRVMEVLTTEPGLQLYSANFLDGSLVGKAGKPYKRRCAFSLETQHFPDSPNRPEFPSTVLRPGETYSSATIYRFTVD